MSLIRDLKYLRALPWPLIGRMKVLQPPDSGCKIFKVFESNIKLTELQTHWQYRNFTFLASLWSDSR